MNNHFPAVEGLKSMLASAQPPATEAANDDEGPEDGQEQAQDAFLSEGDEEGVAA